MFRVLRKKHHITNLPADNFTHKGLHCPWIDETEWKAVCSWLYGDSSAERRKGVERVASWRARGTVPFPVECTADIVQCILREESSSCRLSNNESTSLMLAMLITRFVNGVFDYGCLHDNDKERRPIHDVVSELGVPLWLVTLRHDSTHRVLPSLPLLIKGIHFIQKWLWNNYWQPQYKLLPVSDTTALVQKVPSFWHETSPPDSSTIHSNDITDEQITNLKSSLRQYLKSPSDRQQLIRKLYKTLANANDKVFLDLLKSQLFLSTQDNITQLFERNISRFPMLSSPSVTQWEPLLASIGRYRSSAKTNLLHALIRACHSKDQGGSLQLLSAGWIGILLQSTRGTLSQNQSTNSTYIQVDLTDDRGLMAGVIDYELLLKVSKDYPGPYTCAINERLLQMMPHNTKLDYEKLLHFSILLSISESIGPSPPRGSFPSLGREGIYMSQLNKLKDKLNERMFTSDMEIEGEEETVWKKANGMDWYNTPLGCVPGQQLTPISLDLPYEQDDTITNTTPCTSTNNAMTNTLISTNTELLTNPPLTPTTTTNTITATTATSDEVMECNDGGEAEKKDEECTDNNSHFDSSYLQTLQQAIMLY